MESPLLTPRSLLFVPSIIERFVQRAHERGADLVCLDMEDSVPPAEKVGARPKVQEALKTMPKTGYLLYVRVNGLDTGLLEEDLAAVVCEELDGISLPKAHTSEIVQQVDHYLTLLEKMRGLPVGKVKIMPWIESGQAVLNARAICSASPRVVGASFGSEDYTVDMRIERTKESKEIEWARYQIAVACRAAGVAAIDPPEMDFQDIEQLERDGRFARSIGYSGKYCIHPAQVEVVNRIFAATEEEIAYAKRVIEAYEQAEREGRGAVALDGVVIDRPVYLRARVLLGLA
jgi:citrate lyase subunit beta/citryl-CoA lyase